ncbi:MAG: adenosylmethionine--8-amino-7-oxononanoate transaminase [Candidatus Nitronauta litoralis]|uniref:Adenosylmethionine-8-amino-7-oxononanoate aminotransferase n=1 Tax=Candidatus Nitronauta litoralis TaxID=2705533 RepID=A0A7T0BXF9_9BACT|nr:MAG: adenosylmethionine--8-amino-7-oxononanoate transaminase [Candidatus Nitronauta litoralis]
MNDPDLLLDLRNIWHPCTPSGDPEQTPLLLVDKAEGVYLIDREGNRYMDVISSWWVNLLGHNHPRLNKALSLQLEKMAHVMFAGITHEPAINLAENLVQLTPENLTRVFFSDNGSTSVEIALKMSLQYWRQAGRVKKNRFVYLKDGYHGETLGALSVCGSGLFRDKFDEVLMENIEVEGPDCLRCPFGLKRESCNAECFDSMKNTLETHHESLAGVVVEPLVQGAAGMKMYPPVYLKKLEDACEAVNVHVIFDEVATGFYRTGSRFVCEGHELNPNFLCLSKGITSGYLPLAATLTEDSIYEGFKGEFEDFNWFVHSHSYSANPLGCAVANETLSILEEPEFFESLGGKVKTMKESASLLEELPWCGEYRQTGMIGALELVQNQKDLTPFPIKQRVGYKIFKEGLKRGLFLRPLGNVVYFIPPYAISEEEIKLMVRSSAESVRTVLEKE